MSEVKPVRCGCGGASHIVKRLSRDYHVPVWYVECIKCNIETDDYFSEAEAITAWNTAMRKPIDFDRFDKDTNIRNKGEWETVEDYDGDEHYRCSECGEEFVLICDTSEDNEYYFCPHCGADLRGGNE